MRARRPAARQDPRARDARASPHRATASASSSMGSRCAVLIEHCRVHGTDSRRPRSARLRVPREGDGCASASPARRTAKTAPERDDSAARARTVVRDEHDHRSARSHQALRANSRRRRPLVPGRGGPRHRVRGAERRREVDDDASASRTGRSRHRRGTDGRQRYRDLSGAAPRSRRAARRRRYAPGSPRAKPSAVAARGATASRRVASTKCSSSSALPRAARKRTGGFSLGMEQRLGIAAAMLGDPPVLVFDEPSTGSIPTGSAGSAPSCDRSPTRVGPCSCRVT